MLINDKEPRLHHVSTRFFLRGGLAVPVVFVGVILAEGALRPGYEPLHRFGSELALGDRGWVMISNFVIAGVLVLGWSIGLRRVLDGGRAATAAPILAALFGLSFVAGGVFVTDPSPGNPEGMPVPPEPTVHGFLHDANPVPFYLSLIALIAVMAYRFAAEPGGRAWVWFSIGTALAVPATFVLAAANYDMDTGTGEFHGLWQRINLTIGLTWIASVTVRYLRQLGSRR